MITVSRCGVNLQEDLSDLERERLKHWRYTCIFVAFLNIHFFHYFFSFSFHLGCNFVLLFRNGKREEGRPREDTLLIKYDNVHIQLRIIIKLPVNPLF